MRQLPTAVRQYGLFLLGGFILIWIPLIGDLHVESAVLASLFGAFYAGGRAAKRKQPPDGDGHHLLFIGTQIYIAAIPLALKSIVYGCISADGIGFWVFFPSMSIFFGYSIGRLFRKNGFTHAVLWTMIVLALIGAGEFLVELFTLPQVYFFNHVWGGWPGPLYDSAVQFTFRDLFFRFVTFCWGLLLWLMPVFWENRFAKYAIAVLTFSLGLSYALMPFFHIVTPRWYLKQVLKGRAEGKNVVIYYDLRRFTSYEIRKYLAYAQFDVNEISRDLHIRPPTGSRRIECYFYGDVWEKKMLVGAKYTSYVPVWNPADQVHIAKGAIDQVLRHELVHVLAKPFGAPGLHASWSIGLTEGLAVALAPDESGTATIDQIVAASKPWPGPKQMEKALSFSGFYTGRSNVSYITAGSFVHYLLDNWPIADFKKAYRSSNLAAGYPIPVASLVKGWHHRLAGVSIDSADTAVSQRLFSVPSIFEETCPHKLTPGYTYYDAYRHAMALKDTAAALRTLNAALKKFPDKPAFRIPWLTLELIKHNADTALREYHPRRIKNPLVAVRMADIRCFAGDTLHAQILLDSALAVSVGKMRDPRLLKRIRFRRHSSRDWQDYLNILTGKDFSADSADFRHLAPANKMLLLHLLMQKQDQRHVLQWASEVVQQPFQSYYFITYLNLIDFLALHHDGTDAHEVLTYLQKQPHLRPRWRQMIGQKRRFLLFLRSHTN